MDKLGQYIDKFEKGKTPKAYCQQGDNGAQVYLSPDYLRGVSEPESYVLPQNNLVEIPGNEIIVLWDGSNAGEVFLSKTGILASTMTWIKPKQDNLYKDYFAYSFKYLEYILKAKTAGSGIPHADKGVIKNLPFYKPCDIDEQKAIAGILHKVDECIESVQLSIKALEKIKTSLMQNLLSGKMKADGTIRSDEDFYIDEKFGKIPNGWSVKLIKDVGKVQTGKTPPTAVEKAFSTEPFNNYLFITPGDLGISKYIYTSERYVTSTGISYSYELPLNTIVLVCIGSTIGKIGITTKPSCTNQQINAISCYDDYDFSFIYYLLKWLAPRIKTIAGINATPQINKSTLEKYHLCVPDDFNIQKMIADKLSCVDKSIVEKKYKITNLKTLKKSLMQNLLTGKVRVNVDEINKLLNIEQS